MIDKDWSVVIGTRSVVEGKIKEVESALLRRDMLDTSKCYLLDCGSELFIWTGRNTSLDLRKTAIQIADVSWHSCAS